MPLPVDENSQNTGNFDLLVGYATVDRSVENGGQDEGGIKVGGGKVGGGEGHHTTKKRKRETKRPQAFPLSPLADMFNKSSKLKRPKRPTVVVSNGNEGGRDGFGFLYEPLDENRFSKIALEFPRSHWNVLRTSDGHYNIAHHLNPTTFYTSLGIARQYKEFLPEHERPLVAISPMNAGTGVENNNDNNKKKSSDSFNDFLFKFGPNDERGPTDERWGADECKPEGEKVGGASTVTPTFSNQGRNVKPTLKEQQRVEKELQKEIDEVLDGKLPVKKNQNVQKNKNVQESEHGAPQERWEPPQRDGPRGGLFNFGIPYCNDFCLVYKGGKLNPSPHVESRARITRCHNKGKRSPHDPIQSLGRYVDVEYEDGEIENDVHLRFIEVKKGTNWKFGTYVKVKMAVKDSGLTTEKSRHNAKQISTSSTTAREDDVEESFCKGDRVDAAYHGQGMYPGEVDRVNSDGTYDIKFDDGDRDRKVKASGIRKALSEYDYFLSLGYEPLNEKDFLRVALEFPRPDWQVYYREPRGYLVKHFSDPKAFPSLMDARKFKKALLALESKAAGEEVPTSELLNDRGSHNISPPDEIPFGDPRRVANGGFHIPGSWTVIEREKINKGKKGLVYECSDESLGVGPMSRIECLDYVKMNRPHEFYVRNIPPGNKLRDHSIVGRGGKRTLTIPNTWTVRASICDLTSGHQPLVYCENTKLGVSFHSKRECVVYLRENFPKEYDNMYKAATRRKEEQMGGLLANI